MFTVALSGPKRSRAKAELLLEEARLEILPSDHHALMDWRAKFPDSTEEWLTVEHDDIDEVVGAVAKAKGWRLRVHQETPELPGPSAEQALSAKLAEMQAEIEALKAKVG